MDLDPAPGKARLLLSGVLANLLGMAATELGAPFETPIFSLAMVLVVVFWITVDQVQAQETGRAFYGWLRRPRLPRPTTVQGLRVMLRVIDPRWHILLARRTGSPFLAGLLYAVTVGWALLLGLGIA